MTTRTRATLSGEPPALPAGYRRKRCEACFEMRACARAVDPYLSEMTGERRLIWVCDDCYRNKIDDI